MDFNKIYGDITKCIPTKCKIKNQCVRFTSKPDENYQSYSFFDRTLSENEECEFFWDNKE